MSSVVGSVLVIEEISSNHEVVPTAKFWEEFSVFWDDTHVVFIQNMFVIFVFHSDLWIKVSENDNNILSLEVPHWKLSWGESQQHIYGSAPLFSRIQECFHDLNVVLQNMSIAFMPRMSIPSHKVSRSAYSSLPRAYSALTFHVPIRVRFFMLKVVIIHPVFLLQFLV